jgi:hypothetical protein
MRRLLRWVLGTSIISSLLIVLPCFNPGGSFDSIGAFVTRAIDVAYAEEGTKGVSITKFRVQALYKAVKVSWKVKKGDKTPVTFEIYRSMAKPDGPYILVTSIKREPGVKKYKYLDKSIPVGENYFYKIVIPEMKKNFGPLKTRPYFSLPTT